MTQEQKSVITAVISTLNRAIPVITKEDMDAKLGCILALEQLLLKEEENAQTKS